MRQLLVSSNKNFVYHFIPKTGCTSLKYHLQNYIDGMVTVPADKVDVHDSPLHRNAGAVARDSHELGNFPDHYKFLVVRNPYDRLLSFYYEYVLADECHFTHFKGTRVNDFPSYIDFLKSMKNPESGSGMSWSPQHDHVMPISVMSMPLDSYTKIYKLEENCFGSIQHDLNLNPFEDVRFNVSSRLNTHHDLTTEQIDLLCEIAESTYKEDLHFFKYTREDSKYLRRMDYASR